MASLTYLNIYILLVGGFFISLDDCFAAANNQFAGDSAIGEHSSSYFFYQKPEYPRDCSDVGQSCSTPLSDGVYLIKPDGYEEPFEVYCENGSDATDWTVIFRRSDGSVYHNRNWENYKRGFGFLSTEFWLGNDKISYLTNQAVYELRIDITFDNGTECDLQYSDFRVSDEWSGYAISPVLKYGLSDSACRWTEGNIAEYTDCNDVYADGHSEDGVYFIRPEGWKDPPFKVFCNMSIDGGNWTVFQRRKDGSINFYRNWTEYRSGFGNVENEFWLGNEKLHFITKQTTYEYRIDYVYSSSSYHNKYTNFYVDNETNKYRLASPGTRSGTRGHSLYNINNTPFSTHDRDNDERNYDCAEGHRSGWWHGAFFYTGYNACNYFHSGGTRVLCSYTNPNGEFNGGVGQNIFDHHYGDCNQKYTELKIRRRL